MVMDGNYDTALKAAQELAFRAEKASDLALLGHSYLLIADCHYYLGRLDQYRFFTERALHTLLKTKDQGAIGRAYYNLAYIYERQNPEEMLQLLQKALPFAESSRDVRLQVNIASATGTALWVPGINSPTFMVGKIGSFAR